MARMLALAHHLQGAIGRGCFRTGQRSLSGWGSLGRGWPSCSSFLLAPDL